MSQDKPVTLYAPAQGTKYQPNFFAQQIMLKALTQGITDPKELRKLTGLKSAAEVYRTLDRMAIRREYHNALADAGLDLGTIVAGIRDIAISAASSDSTKLKALVVLMKSLGLDTYKNVEESGKSWEEMLVQASSVKALPEATIEADYEVIVPKASDQEVKRREVEKQDGEGLYDTK